VRWNSKLEQEVVVEKQQRQAQWQRYGGEAEERKARVSPHMRYLARLSTNAKMHFDESSSTVKPSAVRTHHVLSIESSAVLMHFVLLAVGSHRPPEVFQLDKRVCHDFAGC